jgi:PST family polysaccharide transporter
MARALTPGDYGLVTLVLSGGAVVSSLGDLGIGRALVQYRDDSIRVTEDTALVIATTLGAASSVASVAAGWILARSYSRPAMISIGAIIGLSLLLNSLYLFQMNCLNRDLKFGDEARQNLIFAIATAATRISLALAGCGPYALVLQTLGAQVISNIAIQRLRPLRWPKARSLGAARRMLGYGLKVTLAQYANNLQQPLIYPMMRQGRDNQQRILVAAPCSAFSDGHR